MDLARLPELKQKLLHENDLARVWDFFMDHFADRQQFTALGERAHDNFVETVVGQVGLQLYGTGAKVIGLILTRLPEHQFIHGGFLIGGRPGGVICFEDLRAGLVAIPELPPSIEVKYARFSGQPLRRPAKPSRN
jgi:hypothetical protein